MSVIVTQAPSTSEPDRARESHITRGAKWHVSDQGDLHVLDSVGAHVAVFARCEWESARKDQGGGIISAEGSIAVG